MTVKGILFIVSAPSGAGKTTLFNMAMDNFNYLHPSISCTTRPKRENEVEGKDYFFVSEEAFKEMQKRGKFVESATVHGYNYGTPRDFLESCLDAGRDVLFDIDVQGAKALKDIFPESVYIFILPPSFSVLKERLKGRKTNEAKDIDVRLKNAAEEIKNIKEFDYLIINDNLNKAFEELKAVIISTRLKKKKETFDLNDFFDDE